MRDVEISADARGWGRVIVGGVDISKHVVGVRVSMEPGQVTRVEIEVVGDIALDAKQADVTLSRSA